MGGNVREMVISSDPILMMRRHTSTETLNLTHLNKIGEDKHIDTARAPESKANNRDGLLAFERQGSSRAIPWPLPEFNPLQASLGNNDAKELPG